MVFRLKTLKYESLEPYGGIHTQTILVMCTIEPILSTTSVLKTLWVRLTPKP